MVPNAGFNTPAEATSLGESSAELVEFDGIALFTVPSLQHFYDAFKDPYYADTIEPDERFLLDKEGTNDGAVAKFVGNMFDMVNATKSTVGDKGKEYRDTWEEFEKKAGH